MLFYDSVGVNTTGMCTFTKIADFFADEKLEWKKYVSVTTDGASAMVRKFKGFSSFVKK